ncbi:MAG TPA: VOC family protein [Frankiaceae bacterium]|jgi:catechol 2,3-dioxygenase-like lactoylglutathione lyase family enzyme|nr:VOC family protein [Frankiaceae bacterium]
MPVTRLNHAVLYVSDVRRSVDFYSKVMGFEPVGMLPEDFHGAAFLRAGGSTNDHDLGLFEIGSSAAPSAAGAGQVGMYHLAWEVNTLAELSRFAEALSAADALVGASDHGTTKSLYAKDPDGLEFEVVWLIPAALLEESDLKARSSIRPLNLPRELERFGSETRGGVGVSAPA